WQKDPGQGGGHGIVPLHHHQALWNVRQHPAVYEVFRDLYGRDDLWVTMDRVSYKPPAAARRPDWCREPVHWDCDPWSFDDLSIQGLVYLTDTDETQGAFSCVPAIYRDLDNYRAAHVAAESRRHPDVSDNDLKAITGTAGSLVLFHRLLPHTSRLNESAQHRFVQYVAMQPVGTEADRQQRIREWQERLPPAWAIRQKIAGQQIPEPGEPARLTELGKRLVGIR
ncbi:MAG: phytanoyl-CoA dioxygenase family protein, partial [Pseudomonadales bacterium]